jgi:hypothetical protein
VEWWTGLDAIGNFSTCVFMVTVEPPQRRMEGCPDEVVVTGCDPGGAVVNYTPPSVTSVCGTTPALPYSGPLPGSVFPYGTTQVEWWSGLDANGDFVTCVFNVTVVEDATAPILACPEGVTAVAPDGGSSVVVPYDVEVTDECPDGVTLDFQPPIGTALPCGTTPVTVTARDAAGNASTCTFDVTVALSVPVDIRPGGCPNPLNTSTNGTLPVAIMASSLFDVNRIDPASVRLAGVAPTRWAREDVGAPFHPFLGKDDCQDCNAARKDRLADLTLKFNVTDVVAAIGNVSNDDCLVLQLTGRTRDGCPIVGEDMVRIGKGIEMAAIDEPAPTEAPSVEMIDRVRLHAARPNPLRRATTIAYDLPAASRVRLGIYDVVGRLVRTLVDDEHGAGRFQQEWDGNDPAGQPVVDGVYFSVLTVEGAARDRQVRKLIVRR